MKLLFIHVVDEYVIMCVWNGKDILLKKIVSYSSNEGVLTEALVVELIQRSIAYVRENPKFETLGSFWSTDKAELFTTPFRATLRVLDLDDTSWTVLVRFRASAMMFEEIERFIEASQICGLIDP